MVASNNLPGVLIYNGRPYAVGLLWFTIQEENGKQLLQQRLKKTKADFYCLRQHVSQQQAFGWLGKGHRRGMPCAAAMVADQLVGEWHGIFEADNGWWYVQVRSDTLTPNGDRFFTSEEEAFNVFQEEMGKHNWPHAYAPDKWRLSDRGIRELSLKNLLDDLTTTTLTAATITAVFGSKSVRNGVLGGLAVTFLLMGFIALMTTVSEPDMPVQTTPIRPFVPIKKPKGVELVSPQQLSQQCGVTADKLFLPLAGWKMQKFSCNSVSASMMWQQVTGSLNDAKEKGGAHWPKNVAVTVVNRILTVTMTLDKLPMIEVERLPAQDAALLYLETNLQPLGMLQVKPIVPPAPAAPPVQSSFLGGPAPVPVIPVAPPPYLEINFSTGFAPDKIAPLLRPNGLELKQVDWNIQQAMWEYKIKWTYEKAPPPAAAAPAVRPGMPAVTPQANPQAGVQK